LVRVSAIITKPSRTRIPQQYVMGRTSSSVSVVAFHYFCEPDPAGTIIAKSGRCGQCSRKKA
jgi:hypothetical protein